MDALSERNTSRSFSGQELPLQEISNLLWAGFGYNRENGKRTAPSAHNWQENLLFVFLKEGVFIYSAGDNMLIKVKDGDLREYAGKQDFVKDAPLSIVFIADMDKMGDSDQKELYAYTDAAFISQNIYLYCASEGLATGVRAWVDKEKIMEVLELKDNLFITLAQSVGYPAGQ
ncbi:MAG: nitroreductase family protein [Bacteroidota bacterium]|nr:nitroreductase family protein [Bacteroidota bacterium]